ncbi:MAG TPA: GNAT family N-acetyltransferase [Burkholderiaceae bacterium]|nr:GNAT family N-acetyltransferase [Burkholderiaceae bacterium]HQZ07720.1 GNAT family N-acetyltransferase [Burkholderiaceae bacterium]HRA64114.1 GNAT family N-acetyltransferase [Burkholderiaceae bacterium]
MRVAQLQAADAARYRTLMLQAYELAADAFTSTAAERAAEPESFWARRIANPTGLGAVFGAFEGEELVGTVALEFSARPKTKHKGHVIGMYVAPQARGTGAGRALAAAVIAHASAREGLLLLNLTVTEGNAPAGHLYRSVGFQEFGVEPMAILTPTGFKAKIHMWLPLQQGFRCSSSARVTDL